MNKKITYSIVYRRLFFATIFMILMAISSSASAFFPTAGKQGEKPTLAPLMKQVTPAVVNISVSGVSNRSAGPTFNDPFLDRFFNSPQRRFQTPRQGAGSGVIIDAKQGYVLTNHHVINNAETIKVTLQDRRTFDAELVGSDDGTDIALLKIDAKNLTELPLDDTITTEVGDYVLAIGNPFGLGQTVTSGIVSALGRSGINVEGYEDFIQTDASINPGNSGGALVDLDGNMVGINTAIIAPSGGNVGIGFAVPTHMASKVIDQLLEFGEVRRGRLGVIIQSVTPDLAEALDLKTTSGAVVTQVESDSAADRAGLKAGDVIISVNDKNVADSSSMRNTIGLLPIGDKVKLALLRNGKEKNLTATIGGTTKTSLEGRKVVPKLSGALFEEIPDNHPEHGNSEGVFVSAVEQGSPAWRNGLRQGDIIHAVNQKPINSVKQLDQWLAKTDNTLALSIYRDDGNLFLVLR